MTAYVPGVEERARQSQGRGHERIHAVVASLLASRGAGGTLADVGCGTGDRWRATRHHFARCLGIDAVRYPERPADVAFERAVTYTRWGLVPMSALHYPAAVAAAAPRRFSDNVALIGRRCASPF